MCRNHPAKPVLARGLCSACYQKEPDQVAHRKQTRQTPKSKARQALSDSKIYARRKNSKPILADLETVVLLRQEFGGVCYCCQKVISFDNKTAHLDHDHKTGKLRGVLCVNCNRLVGVLEAQQEQLNQAAIYLRDFG